MNLSICIPTYNRFGLVARAIDSVLCQIEDGDEIVVQDNDSSDGTYKYLCSKYSENKKVKIYKNDQNIGPVLNFSEVINNASNKYVYLLTDDDYLLPGAVKIVKEFIDKNNVSCFKTAFVQHLVKTRSFKFISVFASDVHAPNLSVIDAAKIYHASNVFTGLCFNKNIFQYREIIENKDCWYPSMLLMGKAGLNIGYLAEPTNVHTWENETFWGVNPENRIELNKGQVAIIKYLSEKKYVDERYLKAIVSEHCKRWFRQDNTDILHLLDRSEKINVYMSVGLRRVKGLLGRMYYGVIKRFR